MKLKDEQFFSIRNDLLKRKRSFFIYYKWHVLYFHLYNKNLLTVINTYIFSSWFLSNKYRVGFFHILRRIIRRNPRYSSFFHFCMLEISHCALFFFNILTLHFCLVSGMLFCLHIFFVLFYFFLEHMCIDIMVL